MEESISNGEEKMRVDSMNGALILRLAVMGSPRALGDEKFWDCLGGKTQALANLWDPKVDWARGSGHRLGWRV